LGLEEPNETRFAKLSPAGVADLEGAFERPEEVDRGVVRPELSLRRTSGNSVLELMGGGFLGSLDELGVKLRPLRSSIVKMEYAWYQRYYSLKRFVASWDAGLGLVW
jgi:hypothetical protein